MRKLDASFNDWPEFGTSNLGNRCAECHGLYGHFAFCPTLSRGGINEPRANVEALDIAGTFSDAPSGELLGE